MGETQSGNLGGDTAVADALAALATPDPRSLSWFIGGAMAPEDAAAYQQRVMAQFDMPASVPETVTKSFDRLRAIYQQALLCYDLYTVAGDQARLVAELALRERFTEFYGGTVLFTDGQGKPQTATATTFDEVYWRIRGTDGRPTVLLFFGNWCPSCHQELPPLAAAVRSQDEAGGALSDIRVVGVDSEDTVANAKSFIHSAGVTFPVAYDYDTSVTEGLFYFTGDPYAVFVKSDGKIAQIVRGDVLTPSSFTADERALIPSGT